MALAINEQNPAILDELNFQSYLNMMLRMHMVHSREIKSLTKTISGEAQILELLVTDVTSTILNVFNEIKKIMDKELKKIHAMMS